MQKRTSKWGVFGGGKENVTGVGDWDIVDACRLPGSDIFRRRTSCVMTILSSSTMIQARTIDSGFSKDTFSPVSCVRNFKFHGERKNLGQLPSGDIIKLYAFAIMYEYESSHLECVLLNPPVQC